MVSFLWHDYETYGTHPAVDRPCQFAALRTDADLNPVGDPVVLYCAPANDVLPHPAACLITGITPQEAQRKGRIEVEFARQIQTLMTEPGTCSTGYNSLRFDDEVTRNLFYRNLLEPYEREWKNGNSRWDLINLARMCYALRPAGIEWPMVDVPGGNTEGQDIAASVSQRPSFRLEDLARANGIEHEDAHDALSDVRATIALAGLIRKAQPRLFEWSLTMRDKAHASKLLNPGAPTPIVHTSGRIPASRGCTSLVLPVAQHPDNAKSVIVFDLMGDAASLVESDAARIRDLVFTPAADLPDDIERLPLKAVKWNAVPMVAPAGVLDGVDLDRIGLDHARCERNRELIMRHLDPVRREVREAFRVEHDDSFRDPDLALYGGGFFDAHDRELMQSVHQYTPEEIAKESWPFHDTRLPLMLLRLRARNWPDSLTQSEYDDWQVDRIHRLTQAADSGFYGIQAFNEELRMAREDCAGKPKSLRILDALESWSTELGLETHISDL